jgi:hypothetical protein
MEIRQLDADDVGFALTSWRESHKPSPGADRVPWSYYRHEWGAKFNAILNDTATTMLGAYSHDDKLVGWLAMTPGKRVKTLHWCYVKWKLDDKSMRRRGVMTALLEEADLGRNFVYTLRARRLYKDERATAPVGAKSLDEIIVQALREKGQNAAYISLKEWLR